MSFPFFAPEAVQDSVAKQWLLWIVFHEGQMLQLSHRPEPTDTAVQLAMDMVRAQRHMGGPFEVLLSPAK